MKTRVWSVYILLCSDRSLYTGIAKDVSARLKKHNEGKAAAYTRGRGPLRLLYRQDGLTQSQALKREARIKALPRRAKMALVAGSSACQPAKKIGEWSMLGKAILALWLSAPAAAAPAFVQQPGVVLTSGAVQALTGSYPAARLYYILGSTRVFSAQTTDGVTLAPESGVRLSTFTEPRLDVSSITGLSVLALSGGGFRMVYSAIGSTGTAYRLFSATSSDGLAWANDTGTLLQAASSTTFIGFPSLVKLGTGDWRLYYIQDFNGGNDAADRRIFTALSSNEGRNFAASSTQLLSSQAGEVAAMPRTDNKIRLLYTAPLTGETTNSVLASALSTDSNGNAFGAETGVRFSTPSSLGAISFPFVARTTDTYSWRLYYNFGPVGLSTPPAYGAVAYAPDPVGVTPPSVFRSPNPQNFTITGEVFSPSPTVQMTGNGTISGAGVTRIDDQTITVNFTTQGEALGAYNVVVTNNTGQAGTIVGGITLDFPGGEILLTDNLFRPLQGGRAQIDVTVFSQGRLKVRLLTLSGELVAILFDQDVSEGTQRIFWNGKTAQGNTVASGVYLVNATGPHLNVTQKIVVIK